MLATSEAICCRLITLLGREFAMPDLSPLAFFLSIFVHRSASDLFMSHESYACEIVSHASMSNCKLVVIPVDTNSKLSASGGLL